jgi:diguanylate cyclase (GGDEF) domain
MRFDLLTLYFLAIGTLLLAAAMTAWESRARLERRVELRLFAAGYMTLAAGCVLATVRSNLPEACGAAFSNITMVCGYLLVLNGVAALRGSDYRGFSRVVIVGTVCVWALFGALWPQGLWSYASSVPIAVACFAGAREMAVNAVFRHLRSRPIVIAVLAAHAATYACRSTILPLLAAQFGNDALSIAGKLTMYEGVLFSVALPMAVLALIREESHDELLKVSRTDFLTGLANRRWFFDEGERRFRSLRLGEPLSLLAFDLDHFKAINDRFGHDVGDRVLQAFAQAARAGVGEGTLLGRIGGEEFAALLPGMDGREAMKVAQDVARHFADGDLTAMSGIDVKGTVSIGLAEGGADGETLSELLSAADRALYRAKSMGRNRIEPARLVQLHAAC